MWETSFCQVTHLEETLKIKIHSAPCRWCPVKEAISGARQHCNILHNDLRRWGHFQTAHAGLVPLVDYAAVKTWWNILMQQNEIMPCWEKGLILVTDGLPFVCVCFRFNLQIICNLSSCLSCWSCWALVQQRLPLSTCLHVVDLHIMKQSIIWHVQTLTALSNRETRYKYNYIKQTTQSDREMQCRSSKGGSWTWMFLWGHREVMDTWFTCLLWLLLE